MKVVLVLLDGLRDRSALVGQLPDALRRPTVPRSDKPFRMTECPLVRRAGSFAGLRAFIEYG